MFLSAGDLQEAPYVLVLLCARQRLALGGLAESLALEMPHFGAVLLFLAEVILLKWSIWLLEHFQIRLVVSLELVAVLLLLAGWVLLDLLLLLLLP